MSQKSSHPDHKIGGCIVNKSKIVSVGFNKPKTHVKSNHPYKNIHCELDCILGVDRELLKNATIYLYRETSKGVPAISKPCQWCSLLLKEVGISKICYSFEGDYKMENVA